MGFRALLGWIYLAGLGACASAQQAPAQDKRVDQTHHAFAAQLGLSPEPELEAGGMCLLVVGRDIVGGGADLATAVCMTAQPGSAPHVSLTAMPRDIRVGHTAASREACEVDGPTKFADVLRGDAWQPYLRCLQHEITVRLEARPKLKRLVLGPRADQLPFRISGVIAVDFEDASALVAKVIGELKASMGVGSVTRAGLAAIRHPKAALALNDYLAKLRSVYGDDLKGIVDRIRVRGVTRPRDVPHLTKVWGAARVRELAASVGGWGGTHYRAHALNDFIKVMLGVLGNAIQLGAPDKWAPKASERREKNVVLDLIEKAFASLRPGQRSFGVETLRWTLRNISQGETAPHLLGEVGCYRSKGERSYSLARDVVLGPEGSDGSYAFRCLTPSPAEISACLYIDPQRVVRHQGDYVPWHVDTAEEGDNRAFSSLRMSTDRAPLSSVALPPACVELAKVAESTVPQERATPMRSGLGRAGSTLSDAFAGFANAITQP